MGVLRRRQEVAVGAHRVGGGTKITRILHGTVSVDPPSINATSKGTVAVTIAGVAPGDRVFLTPPDTMEAGLIYLGADVTAANTVTIALYNATASAIDGAARPWDYLVIKP